VFRKAGLTAAAVAILLAAGYRHTHAQDVTPPPLERPDQSIEPPPPPRVYRTTGSRVAIGRNIHIARDEEVTDAVVVIGGSVRVDGRVRDGLVVIGGNAEMGPESEVRGDIVLVGGRLLRAEGAQLRGAVSDITVGEWGDWTFGGVWIPTVDFGDWGRWLTLFGAIFRISLLALMMAFVLIIARAPVARIGRAAAYEPAKAFVVGLAAEVLFLPLLIIASIALIVTIIGIPLVVLLVPIALITALLAMVLGFTGLACRIGEWVEDRLGVRASSAFLATAIGTLLILGPTLLARIVGVAPAPFRYTAFALLLAAALIEFVVWTVGLGATLMTGFGRFSTTPPPVPPPPPVAENGIVPVAG
jgi:hypothetical protein